MSTHTPQFYIRKLWEDSRIAGIKLSDPATMAVKVLVIDRLVLKIAQEAKAIVVSERREGLDLQVMEMAFRRVLPGVFGIIAGDIAKRTTLEVTPVFSASMVYEYLTTWVIRNVSQRAAIALAAFLDEPYS